VHFRVTPKSSNGLEPLPVRLVLPFVMVSAALAAAALVGEAATTAYGYVFLCLLGSASYAVVSLAVPLLHARESARAAGTPLMVSVRRTAAVPLPLAGGTCLLALAATALYPAYLFGLSG
jgi:cellulose synthase (UDP-forming)